MKTGKLRHRVTFQTKDSAKNSFGESLGWVDVYTCWASIDVLKAQMLYQTAQFIAQSTYHIVIRYPQGITVSPKDRIVCGNDTYEIQAVTNPEQRNRELKILAYLINEQN